MLTLLLLIGDRHEQVVACLTSLLFQVPAGTCLELWDNGQQPIIESPMFRGLLELARWELYYHFQSRASIGQMKAEVVERLPERGGILLWTDDDCIWAPGSVEALEVAMWDGDYRLVAPVVVDVLDRGFPDFTGLERLSSPEGQVSPQHHLYTDVEPFEVRSCCGIFMCCYGDLKEAGFSDFPMIHDTIMTEKMPGPKAIVPAAEAYHLCLTSKNWPGMSLPAMYRQGLIKVRE